MAGWRKVVMSAGLVAAGMGGAYVALKRYSPQAAERVEGFAIELYGRVPKALKYDSLKARMEELFDQVEALRAEIKRLTVTVSMFTDTGERSGGGTGTRSQNTAEAESLASDIRELKLLLRTLVPRTPTPFAMLREGGVDDGSGSGAAGQSVPDEPVSRALEFPRLTALKAGPGSRGTGLSVGYDSPKPSDRYAKIVAMLERGELPAGIRTDIVDEPPDPGCPFPTPRSPAAKPWLRATGRPCPDRSLADALCRSSSGSCSGVVMMKRGSEIEAEDDARSRDSNSNKSSSTQNSQSPVVRTRMPRYSTEGKGVMMLGEGAEGVSGKSVEQLLRNLEVSLPSRMGIGSESSGEGGKIVTADAGRMPFEGLGLKGKEKRDSGRGRLPGMMVDSPPEVI